MAHSITKTLAMIIMITTCTNLDRAFGKKYILIGGASLVCQDSWCVTIDLDILVLVECIDWVASTLSQSQDITYWAGVGYSRAGKTKFAIDILHQIIGDKCFEDLEPFSTTILGGIKTLNFPISLGIKIYCWFMCNDEAESGLRKQISDHDDICFIFNQMQKMNSVVDNVVAKAIPVGCYNMQLIKDALEEVEALDIFYLVCGVTMTIL